MASTLLKQRVAPALFTSPLAVCLSVGLLGWIILRVAHESHIERTVRRWWGRNSAVLPLISALYASNQPAKHYINA